MRSLLRRFFVSGIRTRRRGTFFCAAFRKYPKKRRLDCRFFLRSSVLSGGGREGVLPSYRRAASMPHPFGLVPTKPAVLSAANESKTMRNVSKVRRSVVRGNKLERSYLPKNCPKPRLPLPVFRVLITFNVLASIIDTVLSNQLAT